MSVRAGVPLTGPYKSNMGHYLTGALFVERNQTAGWRPPYTLADQDHDGYVSLRRIYMESNDPAEHSFAEQAFSSWRQWEDLLRCEWFEPIVASWRAELDAKLRSIAVKKIIDKAKHDKTAVGFQASKWIAEGRASSKKAAGRPKKPKEPKDESLSSREHAEDMKRLGIAGGS